MQTTRDNERLLTVQELARRLGVPRSWVYSKAAAGEVPHIHVGRYVRFSPEAIERWLAGNSE